MSSAFSPTLPVPQIRDYQDWLAAERGLHFDSYDALWRWSVSDLDAYWQSIWDYFGMASPTPHSAVLGKRSMPGAEWFPGAQVNYARQVFGNAAAAAAAGQPAVVSHDERSLAAGTPPRELAWDELRRQVAALALHLRAQGVEPGDRIAAYLPNTPETLIAFLAAASLGAVWSLCAPDMGTRAVLDRFTQIRPKVLIACDGVFYGGREIERGAVVAELRAALPSVEHLIVCEVLGAGALPSDAATFAAACARDDAATAAFEPVWLPFDHPLWIVYSSGTTGLPKPIVHGHGGVMIVGLALLRLQMDLAPSAANPALPERFHWYSSTGWIMWNVQLSSLLNGTTACVFDGNPAGSKDKPDWSTLWRFVASTRATFFGAGAAFFANCMKAGVAVAQCGDLSRLRTLGTTGSPLSEETQKWGTAQFESLRTNDTFPPGRPKEKTAPPGGSAVHAVTSVGATFPPGRPKEKTAPSGGSAVHAVTSVGATFPPGRPKEKTAPPGGSVVHAVTSVGATFPPGRPKEKTAPSGGSAVHEVTSVGAIWWCNISGGTDFAGAFIGGNRELPMLAGEMQCRVLGCAVEAWNERGESVVDEVGELVCTQPLPSMPLYFLGDEGNRRYLSSYFDMYPGVWRHGDWLKLTPAGGCIIYGRSDSTINRHGLRMGTSELYSAIEELPEVLDSMVVDLEYLGRESYMPLFVVLRPGIELDAALKGRLDNAVRTALSPRFVPNEIFAVPEIPRTLSGKKQELPIKKLLLGQPLEKVVNRDAMANPACLDWYVAFAARRA